METKKLTEQEILEASVGLFGDIFEDSVDKAEEKALFEKLRDVEGLADYLRARCSDLVKAYFHATTPMEQLTRRGAYGELLLLRGLLKRAGETPEKKKSKLKVGGRYA